MNIKRIHSMEDYNSTFKMVGGEIPLSLLYNMWFRHRKTDERGLDEKEIQVLYNRFQDLWKELNLPSGPLWEKETRWSDCLLQRMGYLAHYVEPQKCPEIFMISEVLGHDSNFPKLSSFLSDDQIFPIQFD